MCSNSMVRFNPKEGYFNQGFRGLGKKKEFFTQKMKEMCISQINYLSNICLLQGRTNIFFFYNLFSLVYLFYTQPPQNKYPLLL